MPTKGTGLESLRTSQNMTKSLFLPANKFVAMGLHGMLIRISLIGVIISAIAAATAAAAALAKPGCHNMCGNVEIPYPFGLSKECSLDETFHIFFL